MIFFNKLLLIHYNIHFSQEKLLSLLWIRTRFLSNHEHMNSTILIPLLTWTLRILKNTRSFIFSIMNTWTLRFWFLFSLTRFRILHPLWDPHQRHFLTDHDAFNSFSSAISETCHLADNGAFLQQQWVFVW